MKITTVLRWSAIAGGFLITDAAAQQSFEQWRAEREERYQSFQEAFHARYEAYLQRVTAQWGDAAQLSDANRVVRYSDDLQHRVIVDYENLTIDIDLIDGRQPDDNDVSTALKQLSELSIAAAAYQDPVLQLEEVEDQRSVLDTFTGGINIDTLMLEHIQTATSELGLTIPADSAEDDPTSKRIARITVNLTEQNVFAKRAEPYRSLVANYAEAHNIEPALILAIMQVESSFNPLAQSHIPAFGLMQIVPNSAGIDVNRALFALNEPPSSQLLFQPSDNIQFGSKYLAILDTQYLAAIEDPKTRMLCMIAAYNTGAGNVASVFHPQGRRQIRPAVQVINTLTTEEVYAQLLQRLPYQETRDYLPKVMDALAIYQQSEAQGYLTAP